MIFTLRHLPEPYLGVIKRIEELRTTLKFATSDSLNRWTGLLARTTAARVMMGTNVMEGVNMTQDDAIAAIEGEESLSQEDEDKHATQGYWRAMTYIVQLAKDATYVHNEGTLKSLHYMLLSHDLSVFPGRWRPGTVHVSNTQTNQVVYEGPAAESVPALMQALIAYLNEDRGPLLVKAAMAHLNLTMIHPFRDGNGRMARALQTMVLSREGILDPQFSSIEEYIGRHSAEYYAVLAEVGQGQWNPQHDPLPWIRFALTAHYRQATDLLRRTQDIARLWQELEQLVKRMKINERTVNALAPAALGYKVRNPGYRVQADVSDQVAKYDLKQLSDAGLLRPVGEKRGRYYVAGEAVRQTRQATRNPRVEEDPFADVPPQQPELPGFA
ncbi:MAG: Fic family protein [Proteobacteria bacterium]|jgi:Fic family protein|nr:Fic family protein [Ramlibacter sp.]MCA0212055.1 Fic family protein [Pseudomonadota bacterium]